LYQPEARIKDDLKVKLTVRLLELGSGKDRPWLEHSSDSVLVGDSFGKDPAWVYVTLRPRDSQVPEGGGYLVPWREDPSPPEKWIQVPAAVQIAGGHFSANSSYFFEGSKLTMIRFNPQTAGFNQPAEVKFAPDSGMTVEDYWTVRGPGLVFTRWKGSSSVWLMKLLG
jgi:hypothetical protein